MPDFKTMESQSALKALDPKIIDCTSFWGSEYFLHSKFYPKKNYFVEQLEKNSRYMVPSLRFISNFIDEE